MGASGKGIGDLLKGAAEVVGPDVDAWSDIVHGRASAGDWLSAGVDVVGFVPGGAGAKALFKGGKAALKAEKGALKAFDKGFKESVKSDADTLLRQIPGDIGDEARWRKHPLWSGSPAQLEKGDVILPASALGKTARMGENFRSGYGVPWKKYRDRDETKMGLHSLRRDGAELDIRPVGRHQLQAWAATDRGVAQTYGGELFDVLPPTNPLFAGEGYSVIRGETYRVVPTKPRETFRRINGVSGGRGDGSEVYGPGFKVLGKDKKHPPPRTQQQLTWAKEQGPLDHGGEHGLFSRVPSRKMVENANIKKMIPDAREALWRLQNPAEARAWDREAEESRKLIARLNKNSNAPQI